jgi:predicted CXXCH cytochrome family protein
MSYLVSFRKIWILLAAGGLLIWSCARQADDKPVAQAPMEEVKVAGAESCKSCHESQFNDWQKSDHFKAMQEPADSTVLGDFNNVVFTADGVTSRFFKKDGRFFINTQGDDGKNHDYTVVYTFGHYPLQQYLVSFPGGRLQATRASWDSRAGKWFNQYSGERVHAHDWLHWTGNGQNWNTMCATCHSTNLQKNYSFETDTYNTTWDEINVSCETCHGPGSAHIAFVKSAEYKDGKKVFPHAGLDYGKGTNPTEQLNTCAPCHARMTELSGRGKPSGELLDKLIPQVISNEFYFADGQIQDEVYEYGSFAQSKMFHNNVQCSNCHNVHSGKVKESGNKLCLSCHKPEYDSREHHFHGEEGEATQCVNCHMVTKTFMGNDHRRDHSFRIPRPDQSIVYGTPNACTNCHKNKTSKWAADVVKKWYGPQRAYHFSDDLLPGSLLNEKSELHLVRLLKDSLQPAIARATAAYYLGSIQTSSSAGALIDALGDRNAQVRYQSLRALGNFPAQVWREEALPCLRDNVMAVRIAAAALYHQLPPGEVPPQAGNDYARADAENRRYLNHQTDFAVGNVMVADYEMQSGEHLQAIQHYIRGLRKDSLMNYARFNLATALNIVGQNDKALAVLNEAKAIDPQNDRTFYSLGLLYYELKNVEMARQSFDAAVKLNSQNPSLYYNYGLLLQGMGRVADGEQTLLRGYSINPGDPEINYALAVLYYQQGKRERSVQHAKILKQLRPGAPEYQDLFRGLGI